MATYLAPDGQMYSTDIPEEAEQAYRLEALYMGSDSRPVTRRKLEAVCSRRFLPHHFSQVIHKPNGLSWEEAKEYFEKANPVCPNCGSDWKSVL